ncbi:PhoX family phosphatase [Pseudoduganella sp. SL102]|uniref:PhoX family protein n=1 Tax=Pseudoduganella sp. SL102 TaxID=2995154 RepID=UPI00248C3935|nr:PhoX family phosphatase [Pseudoduganella sp. SL102]WBS00858.1 PhoX family phosphatase [Pseudoduganella sp. SL102]
MSKISRPPEPEDFGTNQSGNPYFGDIVHARLSRRAILTGGLSTVALALFGCGGSDDAAPVTTAPATPAPAEPALPANTLNFESVKRTPMLAGDDLVVPPGYRWTAVTKQGDPIGSKLGAPAFRTSAARRFDTTGAEAELQFGDNHDGMAYFPLPYGSKSSDRGLLAINHEAARAGVISGFRFTGVTATTDPATLDPAGETAMNPDVVRKQKAYHGVSVAEVYRDAAGQWQVQRDSAYARKVHADTWIAIGGPARGHAAMRTGGDPAGEQVRGTLGNCGSGATPWGTYLTCEEDCHKNYFATRELPASDARFQDPKWARYNIVSGYVRDYTWHFVDKRFDLAAEPNETNRFGWVVEIDPYDPSWQPVKRTALGRFAHENVAHLVNADKRVAFYMGDDQGFDYIYKFVTAKAMDPDNRTANRGLLDEGTLYVAKFAEDGGGEWLPLVHGQNGLTAENGFPDQASVLIWARLAADKVGATQMDRPEWLASDAASGWVYATLSNNTSRGNATAPGNSTATPRAAQAKNAMNPRDKNLHGHIIRMRDAGGNVAGTRFDWEMVVLAGTDTADTPDPANRGTIKGDAFSSPDSVMFDGWQRLWIGTDAGDALKASDWSGAGTDWSGLGNDMLLAMDTRSGQVKRFLIAPDGAEVCGTQMTADGRTLFVNIQHPGTEQPRDIPIDAMTWPDKVPVSQGGIVRSATVAITRIDGGVIGI